MRIDRPVFLLGPGRSGSTLVNTLLTLHRDVGYFVSWSNRFPRLWFLALASRLRWPDLERRGRPIRFYPGPTEAYGIWKYCFSDFWKICKSACHDSLGADKLKLLMRRHLWLQGRSRFVSKLTGPPMFSFFLSIFPDARLVWIDRDPRAVCYSYTKSRKISVPRALAGEAAQRERLRQAAERYLAIFDLRMQVEEDYVAFVYDDFVRDPVGELARLCAALDLAKDSRLARLVQAWPMRDANLKWRSELTTAEQGYLSELLERPLRDLGYS